MSFYCMAFLFAFSYYMFCYFCISFHISVFFIDRETIAETDGYPRYARLTAWNKLAFPWADICEILR